MVNIRYVLVFFVLFGFAFLLTQQRMQTKNYDLKIQRLQREVSSLESAKRDVILKTQYENNRLNLISVEKLGAPISLNDVFSVSVKKQVSSDTHSSVSTSRPERLFSKLVAFFSVN